MSSHGSPPKSRPRSDRVRAVRSGAIDIAVWDTGPDEVTPVLLAHGMSWDHTQFDDVAAILVERGMRVVTYDGRGTGASTRTVPDPTDHVLARQIDDCRAVIDSLGGPPPVIGGVSMGAAVTLEVARTSRPGTIAGVVQIAPGVGPAGPAPETVAYLRWIADALRTGGWDGLVDVIRSSDQPQADIAEQVRFARQWEQRFDPDTLVALFDGFCASTTVPREPVVSHRLPSVVLAWADDALHPLSFAEHAVRVLGDGAELLCVDPPRSGDLPVQPVADAIQQLMARLT